MKLIFFDMEGPLSIQDNACEMMRLFPRGGELFDIIKRYDYLLSLEGRDDYDAGNALALIVPFLIHHDITEQDMLQLADRAAIVDGAQELISSLAGWQALCITTSYEQYAARIMQRVGIPRSNLACTRFPIERYIGLAQKDDHELIARIEQQILSLPPGDDRSLKTCLDLFFWAEVLTSSFGLAIRGMKPMGARNKAATLRNFARMCGQFPEQVVAVGDSITDSRMLGTVEQAGGLAVAFNATEDALPYATIGLSATSIGDLKPIIDAWEQGGREAVRHIVEESRGPRLQWLSGCTDIEGAVEQHRHARHMVRQAAGLS